MRREEDQKLWDLLGRAAPPPRFSDFFARDVVRKIRQQPRRLDWLQKWLRPRRLVPATVALLVAVTAVFTIERPFWRPSSSENAPDFVAKIDPQDFEVVADLDVLLASDETTLWDEDQSL